MRKKIKKVAAVSYRIGEAAPKVIAKGAGIVAEKILQSAQESDIPIYEDKKLVEVLHKLDIGELIPPELYEVVAEVLVFVSDLDQIMGEK